MSTGEQYWDAVQKCQGLLAPLVHRSAHYLEILPKIRRWVHRRDWAEHKLSSPRLAKRARLVFDHCSEQIQQFYTEFGAFTREVHAALNRLRDVLPRREVDALIEQVNAYSIESTCRAIQRAVERLKEFSEAQTAIQPAQPAPAVSEGARRRKHGPAPNMDRHRKIAAVVKCFGDNWGQEPTLEKIARQLDGQKVPISTAWKKWKPAPPSWNRAVEYQAELVRKAIDYSLKMVSRNSL